MTERRYSGEIERLRSAERVARLEIDRVVDLSMMEPISHSLLYVKNLAKYLCSHYLYTCVCVLNTAEI